MTFDIAMHNAEVVHIEVYTGAVKSDFDTQRHGKLNITLHVQHSEKTVVHEFIYNNDVWDRWTAAHE